MLLIQSEVLIHAPRHIVWEVITNMEYYPDWNSQLSLINGKIEVGERIELKFSPLFYKSYTIKPKIHKHEACTIFGWKGNRVFNWFLNDEHIFELEERDEQHTVLRYSQRYRGIVVFAHQKLDSIRDAKKVCIKMNAEIKRRVEDVFARKAFRASAS